MKKIKKQKTLDGEISKETKVRCEICGKEFDQITNIHIKTHGITMYEYREQFLDALLISDSCRKKLSEALMGKEPWNKGKTKETDAGVKKNSENISEDSKIQCEICGKKFEFITGSHLKTHGMTTYDYIEQFPDASMASDGHCKKISEALTGKEPTSKMIDGHKRAAKKVSKILIGRPLTEEHKQHLRDSSPHLSGEDHSMFGKHLTEATKQKLSKAKLGKPLTEEHKQHLRGEKNGNYGKRGDEAPNYKGGISNLPYCEKFDDDLKERVRNFFGRCCYVCCKSEQEQIEEMIKEGKRPIKKLDVHHVNYNKMVCCNDVKPLFVPLCRSCHTKTQKDRKYWEEFFTISLKCLTKDQCFLPKEVNKNEG